MWTFKTTRYKEKEKPIRIQRNSNKTLVYMNFAVCGVKNSKDITLTTKTIGSKTMFSIRTKDQYLEPTKIFESIDYENVKLLKNEFDNRAFFYEFDFEDYNVIENSIVVELSNGILHVFYEIKENQENEHSYDVRIL